MNRRLFYSPFVLLAALVLNLGDARAQNQTAGQSQTPGQIVKFDPNLNLTDSVITEDTTGNIGVGTTTPVAKLDVAGGSVNLENSAEGSGNILKDGALFLHNFGTRNTFLGNTAGNLTMSGNDNAAFGNIALGKNTSGFNNVAVGASAMVENTSGNYNTATGNEALRLNTAGNRNTATGAQALFSNIGNDNTASGYTALYSNTTGGSNTATGVRALLGNTSGYGNTASGFEALQLNISGNYNTASGYGALRSTHSSGNTAIGAGALSGTFSGENNAAVGNNAITNSSGSLNVALGTSALINHIFGDDNIAIGSYAGANLPNGWTNIYIGNLGADIPESNTIRIGRPIGHNRFFAAGVTGVPVGGAQVFVNSSGQLGVQASSKRFKDEVRDMGDATSRLRKLRPVSFYYKQDKQAEAEEPRQVQYGLIAEEVAAVYPELVDYSDDGAPFSVRYHLLAPMLLNEVQHQDREIEQQGKQIHQQAAQIAELKAQATQIADLKAQLAAISGRLKELDPHDLNAGATMGRPANR